MIGIGIGIPFNKQLGASGVAPSNTVAPVLSGLTFVGQTLTGTTGTWIGDLPISFNYIFFTAGGDVYQSSASNTLVVPASAAGKQILVNVTATNSFGSGFAQSNGLNIRATILDIYSANVERCYYLSLQRGAYYGSPCVRVRRSGDNAESNFGFATNGQLDTAAITAYVIAGGGTQNGFVHTYFDQSLLARNAVQSTPSKQAQIVNGGVIMTNGGLTITDYVNTNSQGDYTVLAGVNLSTYTLYHYNIIQAGGVARGVTGQGHPRPLYHNAVGDGFRNSSAYVTIRAVLFTLIKRAYTRNSNNGSLYYDGVSQGSTSALDTTTNAFNGYMSNAFGTYTNEDVRGSIVYSIDHNAATVLAITNLLD